VESKSLPFICLDVDDKSTLRALSKRIEEFFPNTMVRLKINGNYSPFFYKEGKWMYQPKLSKHKNRFTFRLCLNDSAEHFIEQGRIFALKQLNIHAETLKLVGDIYLVDRNLPGYFFTDGEVIVIDQTLIQDAKKMANFLNEVLDCKILIDLNNEDNNGIIVLQTKDDIFGVKND
jgi:hypothetical protein